MSQRLSGPLILMVVGLCTIAGCAGGDRSADGDERGAVARGEAPPYSTVAARHNEAVDKLERVWARVVQRITYLDEDRVLRREQCEGTLQVIRSGQLALSMNKAGKRLFWFGCDSERYWWFEMVEGRNAYVGRHERFGPAAGEVLGLPIPPLDLIAVLGVSPLPIWSDSEAGRTQWSNDGRLLGATVRTAAGGYQRVWFDPATWEVRTIELFDEHQKLVIVAEHSDYGEVSVRGYGGLDVRMAHRIVIRHVESETEVRLSLSEVEDGAARMSLDAFDFAALVGLLRPERVIDLDDR